jgi:hypothetical protein
MFTWSAVGWYADGNNEPVFFHEIDGTRRDDAASRCQQAHRDLVTMWLDIPGTAEMLRGLPLPGRAAVVALPPAPEEEAGLWDTLNAT